MYLHCHDCGWEQDDYWSADYNPLKSLKDWERTLLDFAKLDTVEVESHRGRISWREIIAMACENAAKSIRKMVFLRPEDTKGKRCPNCGGNHLDED
jgi:hypothetical protein